MDRCDGRRAIDAIVFDFDGVILDTESAIRDTWRDIYDDFGASFSREEWLTSVGTHGGFEPYGSLRERARATLPPEPEVRRRVEEMLIPRLDGLEPMQGIRAWLEAARRLDLIVAIASSSPVEWIAALLAPVGLSEEFSWMSCRSERLAAKPAPDVYLDACRALGVEPRRALAVEDSVNGLAAARAAGLRCVVVPSPVTTGCDFGGADLVLDSLGDMELEAVVDRLRAR
ncbi:MAG TPA: HAD-IA family hydrolase [Acidimicrobiales bacterium]|nr:HAD-IA family hydrolase [Acidimicrobiales bacterium]